MEQIVRSLLSNFTLTFLVIAAIATGLSVARKGRGHLPEAAIAFYCLFGIGFTFLYNFVMHVFFGEMAASFIGWEDSPFQAEVGYASLGFAVVGFLAFFRGFDMRLASIVGPAMFMWGAAVGHIYQIVATGNYAPGNAGIMLYWDILMPILGGLLLWWRYRGGRDATAVSV